VSQVHPVFQAVHRWKYALKHHHHLVGRAHRVHPAHLVLQESLVTPDPMVNLEIQVKMAVMDHPALRVPLVQRVNLVKTVPKVRPATQPLVSHQPPANQVNQERTVHPAHQAPMDNQVPTEPQAQQETKVHPAHPDPLATMVLPATRDHQVSTDLLERGVFAPNIAPPMVVCSSRMAQGDKRTLETFRNYDTKPVLAFSILLVILFLNDYHISKINDNTAAVSPVISFDVF